MEHNWIQNRPRGFLCSPAFPGSACTPCVFNRGHASAPATAFFDGTTRLLPNTEVVASDQQLLAQTGRGTWHRHTPFGTGGYFHDIAAETDDFVSHHILTIDGILGRDTIAGRMLP